MRGGSEGPSEFPGRRRRAARWAVLAVAVAVLASVVIVARVGPDTVVASWRGLTRLAEEGPPAPVRPRVVVEAPRPPPPPDPLARWPASLIAVLTAPELRAPDTFRAHLGLTPAQICARLGKAGLVNQGWRREGDEWVCESALVPVPGSASARSRFGPEGPPDPSVPRPSTLYMAARGPARDRIAVIRFKLNLDDASVGTAGRETLVRLLDGLAGPLAWSVPREVRDAIRLHRKVSLDRRGVLAEVHPESGRVQRVNVVLILQDPASMLPARAFRPREIPVAAAPAPAEDVPAVTGETGTVAD